MVKRTCYQEAQAEAGQPVRDTLERGLSKGPPEVPQPSGILRRQTSVSGKEPSWTVSVCLAFCHPQDVMRVTQLLRTSILLTQIAAKVRARPFSGRERGGGH